MSEHLSINGKNYVPSNILAGSSGYTQDYVGKLAREEKILGLQIGRQWFIEPTSLDVFLHKINFEKELAKDELRVERKKERVRHQQLPRTAKHTELKEHSLNAFAQALAVLCCGIFFSGLGMVVTSGNVTQQQIAQGAGETLSFLALQMVHNYRERTLPQNPSNLAAASAESFVKGSNTGALVTDASELLDTTHADIHSNTHTNTNQDKEGLFTVLPVFSSRAELEQDASLERVTVAMRNNDTDYRVQDLNFSDEVRVGVNEVGETVIEPVFKNQRSWGTQLLNTQFVLVPVLETQQ